MLNNSFYLTSIFIVQFRAHGDQSDPPMIEDEEMLEVVRKKEVTEDGQEQDDQKEDSEEAGAAGDENAEDAHETQQPDKNDGKKPHFMKIICDQSFDIPYKI